MKYTPFNDKIMTTGGASVDGKIVSSSIVSFLERTRPRGKYNPHAPGYVTGSASGSITSEIDRFRQGINISTPKYRNLGLGGAIDSGRDDFIVVNFNEGQPKLFDDNTAFTDKPNFENIGATDGLLAFARGTITNADISSPNSDQPILQASKGYNVTNPFAGAIEVIESKLPLFNNKIYSRSLDPAGNDTRLGIKASFAGGNDYYLKGSDQVQTLIPLTETAQNPYHDKSDAFVSVASGSATLIIMTPNDRHRRGMQVKAPSAPATSPFNETVFANKQIKKAELTTHMEQSMKTALLNLSGSTDRMIPDGFKSSTTGLIFSNNGINLDSIAYGGMNRNA